MAEGVEKQNNDCFYSLRRLKLNEVKVKIHVLKPNEWEEICWGNQNSSERKRAEFSVTPKNADSD